MSITNMAQLEKILSKKISIAVDDTMEIALAYLRDNILEYVYNAFAEGQSVNKIYFQDGIPTYEFYNAFDKSKLKSDLKTYISEISYNWQSMSVSRSSGDIRDYNFKPAKHYNDALGGDIRSQLAEYLNTDEKFMGKEREPYWDITLKEFQTAIPNWLKQNLRYQGLNVQ